MRLALKIVGGLVVTVLVLAVVAVFVLTDTTWGHEQIRTRVVAALNKVAHGKVGIEAIDGNLLHGVTLRGVVNYRYGWRAVRKGRRDPHRLRDSSVLVAED